MRRTDGGTYTCTAFNELGNIKGESKSDTREDLEVWSHGLFSANLNVVYKPECSIRKEVREQVLYLSCLVKAFPPNVTYYWYQGEHLISCKSLLTYHIFSSLTLFQLLSD